MDVTHTATATYHMFAIHGDATVSSVIKTVSILAKHIEHHPENDLVMDLSNGGRIDSGGIRFLLNVKKRIDDLGTQFYILHPSEKIRAVIDETNLAKVFTIIDSTEELERRLTARTYERYLPYTTEEDGGIQRLRCACPVCGSRNVAGYLLNQDAYDWRWPGSEPFPQAFLPGSDRTFPFFSLLPIVCPECYMASLSVTDFGALDGDSVALHSSLHDEVKLVLTKLINKRRKSVSQVDSDIDNEFHHPRDKDTCYQAYALAESCARASSVGKQGATPFDIAYMNYLAIRYAKIEQRKEHIDACRTWLTQALSHKDSLSLSQLALSHFIMLIADMDLEKMKEASQVFTSFGKMVQELPSASREDDINSPRFWFAQARVIWQREIKERSEEMKLG